MTDSSSSAEKISWVGRVLSVQPRIRLTRSFDQRYHTYLGFVLRIDGQCGERTGEVLIAVGESAQARHGFRAGMNLSGLSASVLDPRGEIAQFYKTSAIRVTKGAGGDQIAGPPFLGVPPDLATYRARGHRRLDPRTYEAKCSRCMWGCKMPVEMIIDHWQPWKKEYRFETFCYGPKSCVFYRAGAERKVPGRRGMMYIEEDWVDEDATSSRGPDD